MDLGVPGPDKGAGGTHVIVPPDHRGALPEDAFAGYAATNRVMLFVRAIPQDGDVDGAIALIRQVRIAHADGDVIDAEWADVSDRDLDLTAGDIETTLAFWTRLHELIDREPLIDEFHDYYGELAALGIAKGRPFRPDARTRGILERAAQIGNAHMRVQSFADRRPDRAMWADRQWEWASLRPDSGDFETPEFKDLEAREKWFYQAILESPAMFRREAGGGSLYWLGLRDNNGAYLDGGASYRLRVPLPVPAGLFWSITAYDPLTRSELQTAQGHAALRSMFELADGLDAPTIDLFFGPEAPEGHEAHWLQTVPGRGWFVYFRIYGPGAAAFDGSWKLGDFENI